MSVTRVQLPPLSAGRCQHICLYRPANDMVSGCFPPPLYIRCKGPLFSVVETCEGENERLDEVLQKCVVVEPDDELSENTSELSTELPTELPTEFPMLLSENKNGWFIFH